MIIPVFHSFDPVQNKPREENKMIISVYDDNGNKIRRRQFDEIWDIRPIVEAAFELDFQVLLEKEAPEEEDANLTHLIEQDLVK